MLQHCYMLHPNLQYAVCSMMIPHKISNDVFPVTGP